MADPNPLGVEASQEEPAPKRRGRRALIAIVTVLALVILGGASVPVILDNFGGPRLPDPPSGTPQSYEQQQPNWRPCDNGAQCADVYAPLDWTDPKGERITLHLVKQPATGRKPLGTLFVNPGGPGASGADYVMNSIDSAVQPSVRRDYDVVGWDPRGVGQSSPVECLDDAGLDDYLFGVGATEGLEPGSDAWISAARKEAADFGKACLKRTGALLGHVDTASTVRDLDMLRGIVGDPKLNYLGYSYGTYIGARYADAYPAKVGRMVLDGAMDPKTTEFEVVREQTRGFELALRAYAADCLTRADCPLQGSVDDAMGQIGALLDSVDEQPLRGSDGRTLQVGTLLTAIITPLYSQSNWPYLDQLFSSVAQGKADVALSLADFYYSRENGKYTDNSTEAFAAINCLDYPRGVDVELMRRQAKELEEVAPTIGRFQGYGDVGCADWPVPGVADRGGVTAAGAAPILVVGTTGDPATPYRWAQSLADQLESGVLVTYRGEGHTAYGGSACVNGVVDDYLVRGAVPASDPLCS